VQLLVGRAVSAAGALRACLGRAGSSSDIATSSGALAAACRVQSGRLKASYTQAYVELSRLVSEYESLSSSEGCENAVRGEHQERRRPLERKLEQFAERLTEQPAQLQEMRPQLEDARSTEEQLTEDVDSLARRCQFLPSTTSDLGNVRDAIKALEDFPGVFDGGGLSLELQVPTWIGAWVTLDLGLASRAQLPLDKEMRRLCGSGAGGSTARPAEGSEIEHGVEGAPPTNTAQVPLLGACPLCADQKSAGGPNQAGSETRSCWDPGRPLDAASKRRDCASGAVAIMCVVDRIH